MGLPPAAKENPELSKLFQGDERTLAAFITQVQNHPEENSQILAKVFQQAEVNRRDGARIIGFTGAPGAGKSTLLQALLAGIDSLAVGVLLIDPSSPFSGGAFLGDRIRLTSAISKNHFVRSLGTRGARGGLCRAARDLVRLLLASGKKYVFVETVGVGQTETSIMDLADQTVVILTPNSGDVVQTLKAGIMEIADFFVINKADQPGAERLMADLHALDGGQPILKTVATKGQGIEDLWHLLNAPETPANRQRLPRKPTAELLLAEISQNLAQSFEDKARSLLQTDSRWRKRFENAVRGQEDPYSLTADLLKTFEK